MTPKRKTRGGFDVQVSIAWLKTSVFASGSGDGWAECVNGIGEMNRAESKQCASFFFFFFYEQSQCEG